ncbi:MAG: Ig-like domain-containing protein [Gemmatimonadales bacterium]
MNKVFRNMLLSGLAVAGLAACGDDVTVVDPPPPPPPPTPQVRAVSVTPDNITVAPGQTVQMTASVTADSGATPTVTWASSDATKATVSGTGAVTVLTSATTGPVAIRATASANGSSASGAATLNVVGTSVSSVSVSPASATINAGTTISAPGTLQASAVVTGTNNPPQTVTWTSLDPTIATVNATGLVTATSTPGPVNIRACSTLDPTKCGFLALTVAPVEPATVQIQSVTFTNGAGNQVPVVLTNVFGQIEIGLNVEPGARNITRVDALIGGQVVATQTFSSSAPAAGAPEAAPTLVILSTKTTQLRQSGGVFVPVVFNGNSAITANLYVSGSSTPIASNAVPVVMNNGDALVRTNTASLVPTSTTPSAVSLNDGNTYFKGTQTVAGFHYVAFGKAVPASASLASDVCGASGNLVPGAASATAGIALTGTFSCAGVEGGNDITGVNATAYAAGAVGPDGTPLTPPAGISTVGSAFQLNGENRWNMITPSVGPHPGPVWVDNKGPVVSIGNVAFNDSFDQPWVNGSYAFAQDMAAQDNALINPTVGVGVNQSSWPRAREWVGSCAAPNLPTQTGADFPETLTSNSTDGKRICTYAEDLLGNASSTGASNYFGIDIGAPTVRFIGATPPAATPLPVLTPSTVSTIANTTIYSIAAPPPAEAFGVEALDTRSGFHQGAAISNFPATYTFTRLTATGTSNAVISSYALPTLLSDTYVRGAELEILGAGAGASGLGGVGYYAWSGKVTDRAGNSSTTLSRNFAADHLLPPNITGLGFAASFYTPGAAAPFGFSANDDLEIIDATVAVAMDIPTGAGTALRYPLGSLSPLGTRWDATITNVVNGAAASIGYFLFRVDEMCTAAATPYASCPAPAGAPYITTSKPATATEYNNAGANTNVDKLPTNVSANVADVASQQAAAPISAPMLNTQFNPSTGLSQQWSTADLISWSGSTTLSPGSIVATHVASTSIVVPYFDNASLWGLIGTEWVYCGNFPAPVLTDNGSHRFWTYTLAAPAGTNACVGAAGFRVMGTKAGAGLFGPVV